MGGVIFGVALFKDNRNEFFATKGPGKKKWPEIDKDLENRPPLH